MSNTYRVNDRVVYTRDKYTTCPGPRAKNITATPNGESYSYQVDKFWVVKQVLADGRLLLVTRRGKEHVVRQDDPRLRKASLIERFIKTELFPCCEIHQQSVQA